MARQRAEGRRPSGKNIGTNATTGTMTGTQPHALSDRTIAAPLNVVPSTRIPRRRYSFETAPTLSNIALKRKSQPIGFVGRRAAMRAPAAPNVTTVVAVNGSTPNWSAVRPSSTSCKTRTDSVVTTLIAAIA